MSSSENASVDSIQNTRMSRSIQHSLNPHVTEEEQEVDMVDAPLDRPRKRLRLSRGEDGTSEPTLAQSFANKVYNLLGSRSRDDLHGISEIIL